MGDLEVWLAEGAAGMSRADKRREGSQNVKKGEHGAEERRKSIEREVENLKLNHETPMVSNVGL